MTDNILTFNGETILPEPVDTALDKAKEWNLSEVLVIGNDKDGDFMFGSNFSDTAEINLLLDKAKKFITDGFFIGGDEEDDE